MAFFQGVPHILHVLKNIIGQYGVQAAVVKRQFLPYRHAIIGGDFGQERSVFGDPAILSLQPTPAASPDAALPPPLPVDPGAASTEGEVKSRGAAEPGMFDKMMSSPAFKSAMRSAGTVIGREITRSIFGTGRRR